ncbi:hypothetical protein FQA39_LY10846 [Lamprigera yunnana]|nr:hypothetical protein FQA39_LY10846 [Lamprigera yunnana]
MNQQTTKVEEREDIQATVDATLLEDKPNEEMTGNYTEVKFEKIEAKFIVVIPDVVLLISGAKEITGDIEMVNVEEIEIKFCKMRPDRKYDDGDGNSEPDRK